MSTRDGHPHRYLTPAQVSDLLAVPVNTLKDWRYKKIGPRAVTLEGSTVRYREADVIAWLEARRHAAAV